MSSSTPSAEYARRHDDAQAAAQRLDRLHDRLALARLLMAGLAALFIYLGATSHATFYGAAGLCALFFVGVSVYHGRILHDLRRAQRIAALYAAGLRRLDGTWMGKGVFGDRFADPKHPYSGDLDLFGRGSLFELLCTARTRAGENALAAMLTATAAPQAIRARQEAIASLRPRIALREEMALLGDDMRSGMEPERLAGWGMQPPVFGNAALRPTATVLTALVVMGALVWLFLKMSWPFWAAVTLARLFAYAVAADVSQVVRALRKTGDEFSLLTEVLARIEAEPADGVLLGEIRERLIDAGKPASERLRGLADLVGYLDAMQNQLFMPIGLLILWPTHCAFAIEGWRARHGESVARWLDAAGEYEALLSLSSYAYEHPERPFPEIAEGDEAIFAAEALYHPLMPPGKAVANDVTLDRETQMLIVSGSNMSGKSTLLRSVGANSVLAMAGAPVCAASLRIQPRTLGASIRTQDSLEGGISRFYAEILRLRQIVELAEAGPTLFLIDEILHGTNSHDRRVGGEAVLRALIARGAPGLATTHDLALARIAEDPALHAGNVHLEDQIVDGKMSFDYHLRPGIVTRSNALELMRAVGLEV